MKKIFAVIAAAGSGKRMQLPFNKLFLSLNGKTVLEQTAEVFYKHPHIDYIVVVHAPEDIEKIEALLNKYTDKLQLVSGGEQRYQSVYNALKALPEECEMVLIHDAARPFVTDALIDDCIRYCTENGNAVAGVPVKDTIKQCDTNGLVLTTPQRSTLWSVQTPQTFFYKEILAAYESTPLEGVTDDASVLENAGGKVHMMMGDYNNVKITTPEDIALLKSPGETRIGIGYDVHAFANDRKLILGGVHIPHTQGLLGHSDADVLIHAIMDAMLGAAALGDIGKHFPDNDGQYKDISSIILLKKVCNLLKSQKYGIINISAVIMAQAPKLLPHIEEMRKNVAQALSLEPDRINIAATTTERLGFVGRQEGIASEAIVQLAVLGR